MKFSVNWLREFVDLPLSTEVLTDLLTMSGIEMEQIEQRGGNFDNVIVAQITASKQHPNADRLSVCEVNDGSGNARQIVCGAKNYKTGDKVPLALPGAELPNGLKIRASKLRGVESNGMLCSAIELGLGEEASGLLILSPETKIGAPLREVFPPDTIIDVEITPNRGDLLSHLGLAREIGALSSRAKSRDPVEVSLKVTLRGSSTPLGSAQDDITISALRECPFYSIQRIENVRVGRSPDWLRAKIESVGIRSINNVVDVSNFVMLELGQPTHAFDAAKLRGTINVRLAREGETLLALDGRTYSLRPNQVVIADTERAIGLGGVMGGEESGVSTTTTSVLLESAYFSPGSIRRTARELNLPSDASYRFERGVDPQMILRASKRATAIICEIAGGTAKEMSIAGELPGNPADISLRYERVDRVLGSHIEPQAADGILTCFGLEKANDSSTSVSTSTWKIPSYRRDLQREIDLIEEIARAHGINKIPSADRSRFTASSEADRQYDFESQIRRELVALGFNEARTSALIARGELARASGAVELRNPLTEDHVALRTSLVPGLLAGVARNARAGAERIALFEIGNIFAAMTGEQKRSLAIVLSGNVQSKKSWRGAEYRHFDFFDLKGVLESLFSARADEREYRRTERSGFALAAAISSGEKTIGFVGQLASAEANALDASAPVLVAEVDLAELARTRKTAAAFSEMERHPSIRRDIAMFVPRHVTHADISRVISSGDEPLLERVELFDLFSEKDVAANERQARKSLAYSLTYRGKNRTLTNEEVSAAHARIRERLRREIGAQLRE
ncbi:MAG: phenylalanine--tRNA ligase subunit beta [Verrucomicrobia bacterium]|nr:phenylalanine--tRNA ligase subunit beta [Verrucomicrobiota bacterium]